MSLKDVRGMISAKKNGKYGIIVQGRKVKSYTERRLAGPSKTAVIPSTATTPASLAAYRESPLLYSFPANFCS